MKSLIEIRRDLHKIPEFGFKEFKTQSYLLDFIERVKNDRVEVVTWETGIFVKIHGLRPTKTIGYRADMDGLPIQEQTGYPFLSEHEGAMHACGHDFHMTIALGVLLETIKHPVEDNVVFFFQPAEEGPGGAEIMMEQEIAQRWKPDLMMALHVAPEYPVGTVATKPGLLFANTSELFITFKGKGGHAAYPHHTKDMVVVAANVVGQLQTIVSRNVDPLDAAVITIGKMTAGTVQNIIAQEAVLEGTIRTLSVESMQKVKARLTSLLKGVEISYDCSIEVDYGSMYFEVNNEEEATRHFMDFVQKREGATLIECKEAMTGEDFGYMLKDVPGFMFWLGVDSPFGLHHAQLTPNEEAIPFAVSMISDYIRTV